MRQVFGVDGNREVDKVPVVLDSMEGFMSGRDLVAVSSDGLGQRAGLMEFPVNYQLPFSFQAPEHGILACFLCLRIRENRESEFNWFCDSGIGLKRILAEPAAYRDQPVEAITKARMNAPGTPTDVVGYEPFGNEWRTGWANIHSDIDARDTFLTVEGEMEVVSTNFKRNRAVNEFDRAFASTSLGQAFVVLDTVAESYSQIPLPEESIYSGT